MLGPRVIEVLYTRERGFYTDCPIPALLHVNQEWRYHALEKYAQVTVSNDELIVLDQEWEGSMKAFDAHNPQPNDEGTIFPFGTFIDYDRDTFYPSLGGLYHDKVVCQQIIYSFLQGVLQNPLAGVLQNPQPRVPRIILHMILLISQTASIHHLTRLLMACPGLDKIMLVITDEGVSSKCREHVSSIYPCPRRAITAMEQSKDTQQAFAWNPTTGKVSGSVMLPVPGTPGSPTSWETVFSDELKRHKAHFLMVHPGAEKELWEKLEFSMVNIIRAPAVEEDEEEEHVSDASSVSSLYEANEDGEEEQISDTSSVRNPYEDDEDEEV